MFRITDGKTAKKLGALALTIAMIACSGFQTVLAEEEKAAGAETVLEETDSEKTGRVEEILSSMTLEEKICQMIIPAIRTWDESNVTKLSDYPELAEALRKHQYGGLILFRANVTGPGQIAALTEELQANNLENTDVSVHIPYFMAADDEGGVVVRLNGGTRMTGNMAIGATGEEALANAEKTGRVLGEEMAAAGFNVNFAPTIDVNNNAANPAIGTRSFSDDPQVVAELGAAWNRGHKGSGVITTFKHFPGHGDTTTDSHIGTACIEKTYEQIKDMELVPFKAVIDDGAEMIMTAHITFPEIDDEVTFGDGETKGYYPATMSKKIITDILRGDLGYDGVVVTDALEMDAIRKAELVPGGKDAEADDVSTEYRINIAQKVIEAGVDILLIPLDLNCANAVDFYDDYVDGLVAMTENGTIPEERVDESVTRILELKEKYGILDWKPAENPDEVIKRAEEVIGSDEHHAVEMDIARQAITLLKNEDDILPLSSDTKNIVFLGRQADDAYTIDYALAELKAKGILDENIRIENLAKDTSSGDENAETKIVIDYYYDLNASDNKLHYTDELKEAIKEADVVIGFTKTYSLGALEDSSEQYQGIAAALQDTHAAGGKFVLLSDNLPYDAARYQEADAIMLAYMGAGLDMDPTERNQESGNMGAYNACVSAAIYMMFGDGSPIGTLPVEIPEITKTDEGNLAYTDTILYERGFGMEFNNAESEEPDQEAA